ncbi:hypothetical protein HGB07_10190, partial [Candidatus Roizmanbacteria bacterium]|nr:hypothetical protein [Candidatus Roizmanbacteria bacterium]
GHNIEEVLEFTGTDNVAGHGTDVVHIKTLEGVMTGSIGDWIIKGIKDEFYPCKPEIFKLTYDPIW